MLDREARDNTVYRRKTISRDTRSAAPRLSIFHGASGKLPQRSRSHKGILSLYFDAAMEEIRLETLEDGSCYCEIPSCPGVWANEQSESECKAVAREVLEEWLLLKLRDNDPIPVVRGVDLNRLDHEEWDQ